MPHAGGVGNLCQMEVSKPPKKLLISRHSCIDVCKNGVDSYQVYGLFFGEMDGMSVSQNFRYQTHMRTINWGFTSSPAPGDVWFVDSSGLEILCKGLSRLRSDLEEDPIRGTHHPSHPIPFGNRQQIPQNDPKNLDIWVFQLTLLKHPPGGEHHADAGLDLLHRLCHLYGGTVGGDCSRCGMRFFFHNSGSEKKIYLWKDSWETNISKKWRDPTFHEKNAKWRAAVRHWSSGRFSATAELPQGQCEPFLGARRGAPGGSRTWVNSGQHFGLRWNKTDVYSAIVVMVRTLLSNGGLPSTALNARCSWEYFRWLSSSRCPRKGSCVGT